MRHRVLKWARFVFHILILILILYFIIFIIFIFLFFCGGCRLPFLCWLVGAPPICHQCHLAKNDVLCFPWLYGLFVRKLISRTGAYAGCGRPTLNFIERFELESLRYDTAKQLHLVSLGCKHRMCTDCVAGLAWMWTEICFTFFGFGLFRCDTNKASDNLTWKKVSFCRVFCCHRYMLSGCHKDLRLSGTNYIRFISKCWCAWGNKCNIWSRGRFKWRCRLVDLAMSGFILFATKSWNKSWNTFARARSSWMPLKKLSPACEVEAIN